MENYNEKSDVGMEQKETYFTVHNLDPYDNNTSFDSAQNSGQELYQEWIPHDSKIEKILVELSGIVSLLVTALSYKVCISLDNAYIGLFFCIIGFIASLQVHKLKYKFSIVCAALAIPFSLFSIGCYLFFLALQML